MLNSFFNWFHGLFSIKTQPPEPIKYTPISSVPFVDCFHSDDIYDFLPNLSHIKYPFDVLASIVKISKEKHQSIDFREISSFSDSKSKQSYFTFNTIEEFGKSVWERERWTIEGCMKHIEDNVFYRNHPVSVTFYKWNKRLKISNPDGSHHFAAAVHLLNSGTPYAGNTIFPVVYREISIDSLSAKELFEQFYFFVITRSTYNDIFAKYKYSDMDESSYLIHETKMNHCYIIAIQLEPTGMMKYLFDDLISASSQPGGLCVNLNAYLTERM